MARFLLSQYAIKKNNNLNNNNNNRDKKGDKSKKDNSTKSEDKNDNATGTVCTYVGEAASDKDKTIAPSDSSSIRAHISAVTKNIFPLLGCVRDIFASHLYNDQIWGQTDTCDVLVDTINSVEDLAGAFSRIRIIMISQIKNVTILDKTNDLYFASAMAVLNDLQWNWYLSSFRRRRGWILPVCGIV